MNRKGLRADGKRSRRRRSRRRDLRRRIALMMVCVGVPIAALGVLFCHRGDRPDASLQRARIALAQGLTDQAIALARQVLDRRADHTGALALLSEARLARGDLVGAWESLRRLESIQPDWRVTRRLLLQWSLASLDRSLRRPGFASDPERQTAFDEAERVAELQADWFAGHPDDAWPEALIRARLKACQVRRLELLRAASSGAEAAGFDERIRAGLAELEGHLDRAISGRPDDVELWGHKAELLARTGREGEALTLYRRIVERSPKSWRSWLGVARAAGRLRRFPEAEAAYRRAEAVHPVVRPVALVERARLLAGQGLHAEAAATYLALIEEDPAGALPWSAEIGRTLYRCERLDEARAFLRRAAEQASSRATAEVMLARIDQRQGRHDDSARRLRALLADGAQHSAIVRAMSGLNPLNASDRAILRIVDESIKVPSLAPQVWARWLSVRVRLADLAGDWERAVQALDMLGVLGRDITNTKAAEAALLVHLGRKDRAGEVFKAIDGGACRSLRRLVAGALGERIVEAVAATQPIEPRVDLAMLAALARSDDEAARRFAEALRDHPVLYGSDMWAWLSEASTSGKGGAPGLRRLALAVLARETGLHGLSEAVCRSLIAKDASLLPGHAVLAMATLDLGRPIAPVLARLREAVPAAALTDYLRAREALSRGEHAAAIEPLRRVLAREPGHAHVAWVLAEALTASHRPDEAITVLSGLADEDGGGLPIAHNALAYLLAEHQPRKLPRAYRHAGVALRALPRDPAVLDTFGWIEHLRGRSDQAVRLLTLAAGQAGAPVELHYHLGMAYSGTSERDWGRYHLREALRQAEDEGMAERVRAQLAAWGESVEPRGSLSAWSDGWTEPTLLPDRRLVAAPHGSQ